MYSGGYRGSILHLASLGADVADPLATDRSRVHKLCINAARVGDLESRTMEQPFEWWTEERKRGEKKTRRNDVEESERSRPKGREGRRGVETREKNRADGERGMKVEREPELARARTLRARSTRICILPLVPSFLTRPVLRGSGGERAGCTRIRRDLAPRGYTAAAAACIRALYRDSTFIRSAKSRSCGSYARPSGSRAE